MEMLKIQTQVNADGTLHLTIPPQYANQQVEVVLVLQTLAEHTAQGYPSDYFARMDAIESDDMTER